MKRLLLVDQFGHWGGGQVVLRDVAIGAAKAGIETQPTMLAGWLPSLQARATSRAISSTWTLWRFEGAHTCLVPSQVEETFGLVAAEAMAASVPVIVSEIGALPEVVRDAGIRVSPGDVAALSTAMSRLLTDEGARRALAEAGRDRARQLFSRERQVSAVLEALDHHSRWAQ